MFFERHWHDTLIQDYLSLLKVFKETTYRYFVDMLIPDKQKSVFADIDKQLITYSPFTRQQTGLAYKLVLNAPLYGIDTSIVANQYMYTEDAIGFGLGQQGQAFIFTDSNLDTVEIGSIIYFYPVEYANNILHLYKLFAQDYKTGINEYANIVSRAGLLEVGATSRYTLSGDYGFIWQIQYSKTQKQIDLNNIVITEILVYDTYTNAYYNIDTFLTLYNVRNIYTLLRRLSNEHQARLSYLKNGLLFLQDRYTIIEPLLLALNSVKDKRDLGIPISIDRQEIQQMLYKNFEITDIPDNHAFRLYIDALTNNAFYEQLLSNTTIAVTKVRSSIMRNTTYAHNFVFGSLNNPMINAYQADATIDGLIKTVFIDAYNDMYWYRVHNAYLNSNYQLLEDIYNEIKNKLETNIYSLHTNHDIGRLDLQMLYYTTTYILSQYIRW